MKNLNKDDRAIIPIIAILVVIALGLLVIGALFAWEKILAIVLVLVGMGTVFTPYGGIFGAWQKHIGIGLIIAGIVFGLLAFA